MNSLYPSMQLCRPLVGVCISLCCGFLFSSIFCVSVWVTLELAILCVIFAWLTPRYDAFLFIAVACCSMLHYALQREQMAHRLEVLDAAYGRTVEVAGYIYKEPIFNVRNPCWTIPCKITVMTLNQRTYTLNHLIEVCGEGMASETFHKGMRFHAHGLMRAEYTPFRGKQFELEADSFHLVESGFSLRYLGAGWVRAFQRHGTRVLGQNLEGVPEHQAFLKAILLGKRDGLPSRLRERFVRTGTMHIFAISGLHVGMVAVIFIALLKGSGMSRSLWGFLLIPVLLFYVSGTGMKPSAVRALSMASVYFLAPLLKRRPDIQSSIALAALFILVLNPSEIHSVGFVLSFAVVSFIVMVAGKMNAPMDTHWQDSSCWSDHVGWRYVRALVITSFAASLASLPLIALFFRTFTSIAFLSNIVVIPLTFVVVLCGWLSLFFSVIFPPWVELCNFAAYFFIELLFRLTDVLGNLPMGHFSVSPPPLPAILLWFAGWVLFFTHVPDQKWKHLALAAVLVAAVWSGIVMFK